MPKKPRMYSASRILKGLTSLVSGPKLSRRRTLHEFARLSANFFSGYPIGEDLKLWIEDKEFVTQFKRLSPHNYFSMERKFALKEFARSVMSLPGSVAECGSYEGASAWFIANEIGDTDFYLFDSFEGLSSPTQRDQARDGHQFWAEGEFATADSTISENLSSFSNIHVMKGWIPSRFEEVRHLHFKLVHIDVDLYEPTYDSLAFFYERMVAGGMIVLDDYGFGNCPGAHLAANEFMKNQAETIIHLPTGQGLIICSSGGRRKAGLGNFTNPASKQPSLT